MKRLDGFSHLVLGKKEILILWEKHEGLNFARENVNKDLDFWIIVSGQMSLKTELKTWLA